MSSRANKAKPEYQMQVNKQRIHEDGRVSTGHWLLSSFTGIIKSTKFLFCCFSDKGGNGFDEFSYRTVLENHNLTKRSCSQNLLTETNFVIFQEKHTKRLLS